jgi:hypothetical protein
MVSIKNALSHDRMAWDGNSYTHQAYVFPSHVTQCLLSLNPMSGSVSV